MSTLIKNQAIIPDTWQHLEPGTDPASQPLPEADILFPVALWQARKNEIISRYKRIGLWLEPDAKLEPLADDLHYFQVIAIHFPKFTDGRGYSLARLLRERHHFEGELRAVGDVLQDQLFFMKRVGFDAWALKEGKNPAKALHAFTTFQNPYQGATDEPTPLFRRRNP
ncbi:DUF934 domain-containing protein [Azovibrio restrictus]|uniref:DUF934 domain-containing protein n=1 Tax=Azovibrio restrictus TaxID=146938 RepID=UPI0026ED1303|nr:DUF934 domain-containing protein [Azovibrio restrictus]